MAKIKLLLNVGIPYAATTPLWYTLAWDNKYCHTGHCKEPHWLDVIQFEQQEKYGKIKKDRRRWFLKVPTSYKKKGKPSEIQRTSFTSEEEQYFFSLPTSIEKYIEYFKKHWDSVKNEYQCVADFSNSNCTLTKDFMMDIRDQILDVFDVKVIMVFRDPVRRLWSSSFCNENHIFWEFENYKKGDVSVFRRDTKRGIESLANYDVIYNNHCAVWGKQNVLPAIMEKIWKDTSELSDFLGYKIDKMHRNVYYPELGSKSPHYEYLKDQWVGETIDIDYDRLRSKLEWLYTDFERTFGYIPEEWTK